MRRASLLAGFLVLAGACTTSAPRATTLCERPARPAATLHDAEIEASFRAFAHGWLARLRKASVGREIGGEFETELRPTGNHRAPWVGVLRYCERQPSHSTVVTELFRYQAGEWVD